MRKWLLALLVGGSMLGAFLATSAAAAVPVLSAVGGVQPLSGTGPIPPPE